MSEKDYMMMEEIMSDKMLKSTSKDLTKQHRNLPPTKSFVDERLQIGTSICKTGPT